MGKVKQLGNKIKGVILANKKKITFASITLLCILVLVIGWIYHANKEKQNASITPELARAMNYPEVVEGDEAVEGTDYVKFDAFFLRDIDFDGYAESIRGTSKEIGSEDTLYMELNVQTQGYLKDAKITINGENFYLQTALPKDDELKDNYVGNNIKEIAFNTINNGTQKLITGIVRSGDYSYDSRKAEAIGNNINNYSKVNSVTLTGTYVGETGEVAISKTVDFTVDWYGTTEAEIDVEVQNYENLESGLNEEDNIFSLEFSVKTREIKQELILKGNHVEITIPDLNGYSAINAEYTGSTANSSYDVEKKILTIDKETTLSNNTYNIKVTYPIEAYKKIGEDTVSIVIPVKTYYEGYNNSNEEFENPYKSNTVQASIVRNYSKPKGTVAIFEARVGVYGNEEYIVSKDKTLKVYNGMSTEELENTYEVKWYAYTGSNGESTGIIMKETKNGETQISDQIIKNNSGLVSMENMTTNIGIGFSDVSSFLKDKDGWIKVYDEETGNLIVTFTKEECRMYTPKKPYLYETPIKHVRIETSSTNKEASVEIYHQKKIDDEYITMHYSREEFDSFQYIQSTLSGYIGGVYVNTDIAQAKYEAPYSVAELKLTNNTISTQSTEKNAKLTIKADYDPTNNQIGWIDGSFLIKFPQEILTVEINNVTVNNERVDIISYEVIEESGIPFIKIYTKNNSDEQEAYDITIDADITVDPRIETITKDLELYAINENTGDYYNKKEDIYDLNGNLNTQELIGYTTVSLSMVAPNSLLTNQIASDFDEKGSEVVSPQIADIRPNYAVVDGTEKTAEIGIQVKNNYTSTISEIQILGKIPFKGNTYVQNGSDLGSTFSVTMQNGGISIPQELQGIAKVYYSEKENPDRDIQKEDNEWKTQEQITNWNNVKTFLIDLGNYTMPTSKEHIFSYTIKIPNGLNFNEIAYSHHGVYFCLDTDEGKYRTQTEPNKLGFKIAEKYNLELTKKQTGKDKLVSGAIYSIKEEGKEEGKTASTNLEGKLVIPNLYAEKIYVIQEIRTPEQYELSEETIRFIGHVSEDGTLSIEKIEGSTRGEFIVNKGENEDYKVTVEVEDEVKASLNIMKKEKTTGKELSRVRYRLTGKGFTETGKVFITNENGQINIKGLSVGEEYTLQETQVEGYYLATPIRFKIMNDNGNYVLQIIEGDVLKNSIQEIDDIPEATMEIENEKIPTYDLQIVKTKKILESEVSENIENIGNTYTEEVYLQGAKFKLYKGTKEIGEYITNNEGKITISGLYQFVDGKPEDAIYRLKEVVAPDGYAKVKDIYFKVESRDGVLTFINMEGNEANYKTEGNTIFLTIEDSPSFKLIKKDAQTGEKLADIKFAIYSIENGTEELAKDSKGEIIGKKEIINGVEYYIVKTNSNGEITANLPEGLYKIVEVEAPEEYDLSNSTYYFRNRYI